MARGVDLFGDRKHAKYSPKNLGQWESFLFARRKQKDERLEWFFSLVNCYKGRSGFLKVEDQCHSLDELVIRWLKVGDIVPTQCTRLAPVTSMYHTLSYILTQPNDQEITTPRVPCWQFLRFGAGSRKGSGGMELPPPRLGVTKSQHGFDGRFYVTFFAVMLRREHPQGSGGFFPKLDSGHGRRENHFGQGGAQATIRG